MKKRTWLGLFLILSLTAALLLGCGSTETTETTETTSAGTTETNEEAISQAKGLWLINAFSPEGVLLDSGKDLYLEITDTTLTYYDLNNQVVKSCEFSYQEPVISGTWSDGTALEATVSQEGSLYICQAENGNTTVARPMFAGVYYLIPRDSSGEALDYDGYAILENQKLSKYHYDKTEPFEVSDFTYEDGKFLLDGKSQEVKFTEQGFICTDPENKSSFEYQNAFEGYWRYEYPDGVGNSYMENNALADLDPEDGQIYYGYACYQDGKLCSSYFGGSTYVEEITLSPGGYTSLDEDGTEYTYTPLLVGEWKLVKAEKADGTAYSEAEIADVQASIILDEDGTGQEIWQNAYPITYSYDLEANSLVLDYADKKKEEISLVDDFNTLKWVYQEEGNYKGETYYYSK